MLKVLNVTSFKNSHLKSSCCCKIQISRSKANKQKWLHLVFVVLETNVCGLHEQYQNISEAEFSNLPAFPSEFGHHCSVGCSQLDVHWSAEYVFNRSSKKYI